MQEPTLRFQHLKVMGFLYLKNMAIFRKIHTSFWSDSFVQDLDKEQKLFYLYLLTNERTKQCGVYEITKKQIAYDLGYSIDKVSVLISYFIKCGKIKYNETTKELAIGKWLKYNSSTSPKVQTCINTEFTYIKDTLLIDYVKSMDTQSQEEEEKEEEKKEEKKEERRKRKAPTLDEVILYFEENEYKREAAIKFYNYYSSGDWKDSNGKDVKSWKQKAQSVWFKEENKIIKQEPKKIRQQDYYSYEEYLYDCKKFNVTPEPQL